MTAEDFKTVQFMTAEEKLLVYKQWKAFLKSKFNFKQFTDKLYKHLINHCGFIAHYNKQGFYGVYFSADHQGNTQRFIKQFTDGQSVEYGGLGWLNQPDYKDLNNAMCEVMQENSQELMNIAVETERAIDLIDAVRLLDKHKLYYLISTPEGELLSKRSAENG